MNYRELGKTGLKVSEIGFGGSRIGGVFAGKRGAREAAEVLHGALDAGINFFDTADMYAQGESEALMGRAFHGRRDRVIVATKGGYLLPARRNLLRRIKPLVRPLIRALKLKRAKMQPGLAGSLSQNFSRSYLTDALEASLVRLQTDYVDLYQLHSPSIAFMQSDAFGEALQCLDDLKRQGKLRFYGIGTEVPEEAPYCLEAPGLSSVQLGFGLLDLQAIEQGTLAGAAQCGVGIIARGCFGGGLLKESLTEAELTATTSKSKRIMALRTFCRERGRSVLDVALQFCLATPAVSVTLLGMHTVRHLTDNLRYYGAAALTAEEYAAVQRVQRV